MKTSAAEHHGIMQILFLFLCPGILNLVEAQWDPPGNNNSLYSNRFTPFAAIIVVILVGALVFITCFSTYVRNSPDGTDTTPNAPSHGGLDASVIETFPTFSYSEVKDHKIGNGALECAVCLNEFKNDETLRLIPKCDHVFHPGCIDAWLGSHVTCPVCRADLVPKPVIVPVHTNNNVSNGIVERSGSRNGECIVHVDVDEGHEQEPRMKRNLSFDYANRLRKAWSSRKFGLGKFRSHSTGHSVVQPVANLERFTLKLPTHVRNEVLQRATLDRARSCTVVLPREGSLRCSYRSDKSNQTESFYEKIERWSDRRAKSVQWDFFTRGFLMKSHKMGVETHQESTSKGNESISPVKMPSFNCLEPKAEDEVGLFSDDQLVKYLV